MQNRKLNILIIASWYKTGKNLTYGSFIEEQARMLQKQGHTITVLHPSLKGTFIGSIRNRKTTFSIEKDKGISVIRIEVAPPMPGLRSLAYHKLSKETLFKIQSLFNQIGLPDIIHSHSIFMGGVIANYLFKKINIPFIHTEHTSGLIFDFSKYPKSDKLILTNVYKNAKKVLFVSEWFKNQMIKKYSLKTNQLEILNNLVDPFFFEGNIQLNSTNIIKFIIIGDFQFRKQHTLLLKAWSIVLNKHKNISLTIAGNGESKKELINEAIHLQINDSINWISRLNRNEVKNQISNHDVVLSSSKIETFGLTIAEAISMGKPVVVTDSGGVRDIVTEKNGIITEQSPQAFAAGIIKLIERYATYDSKTIREYAYQNFSEETIGLKLEKIYSNILEP